MFRQWFAFPSGQEGDDILRNAQWADDRAVEPSEQQRDKQDDNECHQRADGERGDGFHQ